MLGFQSPPPRNDVRRRTISTQMLGSGAGNLKNVILTNDGFNEVIAIIYASDKTFVK